MLKKRLAMMLTLLCFCPWMTAAAASDPVSLMVVSDLHYLAPELFEHSELFVQAMRRSDGKVTQYSAELLAGMLAEARHQQPDLLVLTGDLTFNGERLSHEQLAAALTAFTEETGIPYRVIPGNHDIRNANARRFEGMTYAPVATVTPADFAEIYSQQLRPAENDSIGFSYVERVTDTVWLLTLDASLYDTIPQSFGLLKPAHLTLAEETIAAASACGATVLTATHQSVVPHTEFSKESFICWNCESLQRIMRASSGTARLNLSGHLHIQHIAEDNGVWDAAVGALSVSPHRYAIVTVHADGAVGYEARSLCDAHLPQGFHATTSQWFRDITIEKERPELEALSLQGSDIDTMLTYAVDLNEAYFSGTLRTSDAQWRQSPAYALWKRIAGQSFFGAYLDTLLSEPDMDSLHLTLPPL